MQRFASILVLAALSGCGPAAAPPPPPPLATPPSSIPIPPIASASSSSSAPQVAPQPAPPKPPPRYEALIAVLDASSGAPTEHRPLKQTFADLRALADPRAADGLARFLAKEGIAPRWKTQAALALAELADLRSVPALAWRLKHSPLTLYSTNIDEDIELRRDDAERVACARHLSDLLRLHPDHKDEIAKASEENLFAWAASTAEPHANAMRALAWIGSPKAKAKLRAWADPTTPLPAAGANMFPSAFSIAQSGNRYLGVAWRDAPENDPGRREAFAVLKKNIARKSDKVDISMNALMQGGIAVQGMALRALAIGAAQGFTELGDPKASICSRNTSKTRSTTRTAARKPVRISACSRPARPSFARSCRRRQRATSRVAVISKP